MLAAAAAWNSLSVELSTTAEQFGSLITRLTSEQWMGSASLSMAAAAQPYLAWLHYTADSSAVAAAQAMSSAAAFEAAFAAMVPLVDVLANRALMADLKATNLLGQNVSAIAATEARYGEMWAQDALAMYGYAASSSVAGRLNPLASPPDLSDPTGIANQAAAVAEAAASGSAQQVDLGNVISNAPGAVMSLASPAESTEIGTGLGSFIRELDELLEIPLFHYASHGLAGINDYAMNFLANGILLSAGNPNPQSVGIGSAAIHGGAVKTAGVASTPLAAALGNAPTVGGLSVPGTWSAAAPAMSAGTSVHATGWAVGEEDDLIEGLLPGTAMVDEADGVRPGPRYGVKPIVMPKQGLFGSGDTRY
jgi:PPE-repeat protein